MDSTRKTIDVGVRVRSTPVVLTPDMSNDLIAGASYIALTHRCLCREERKCQDHPASFGCLYLGEGARGIVAKGDARAIDKAEAIAHVRLAGEMGLVHMVLWTSAELQGLGADASRALELCSCCHCCCISRRTDDGMKAYVDGITGLGIARLEGDCNACGDCGRACPFHAITILEDGPLINADRCKGCGRCMATCSQGALKVYPLEMVPSYDEGWHMIPSTSYIVEILKTVR